MKQQLLEDLQEGATCVGENSAESPTLAKHTMNLTAGQGSITVWRLNLTEVSGFTTDTSIFIKESNIKFLKIYKVIL